jgi:hypothetical protein
MNRKTFLIFSALMVSAIVFMDNMCTMCHTAAASKDYVFSK